MPMITTMMFVDGAVFTISERGGLHWRVMVMIVVHTRLTEWMRFPTLFSF